jgi:enoyl-CoA hydratase/carnithine racemase
MPEALVTAERQGDTLIARLNRPGDGNAINRALAVELAALVQACATDNALRALIITGEGPRFFCTGGDVKAYARVQDADTLNEVFDLIRNLLDAIEALPCPVIAAISGYAIGGGGELALACDLRVMDAGAQIGFPQSRLGIMPGWDGLGRLVSLVGRGAATRMLMKGTRISAAEAQAIGLVDEVAPPGEALAQALALAATLAETAPLSLAAIKQALRLAERSDGAALRVHAREAFTRLWFSADHKEAERAFAEKRPPKFNGT